MKLPKLVEVTWDDAQSYGTSAWTVYDADSKALISIPLHCTTVGYLLPETNATVVVLAASLGLGKDGIEQFSGHMTIPRGMVRAIRTLR